MQHRSNKNGFYRVITDFDCNNNINNINNTICTNNEEGGEKEEENNTGFLNLSKGK